MKTVCLVSTRYENLRPEQAPHENKNTRRSATWKRCPAEARTSATWKQARQLRNHMKTLFRVQVPHGQTEARTSTWKRNVNRSATWKHCFWQRLHMSKLRPEQAPHENKNANGSATWKRSPGEAGTGATWKQEHEQSEARTSATWKRNVGRSATWS